MIAACTDETKLRNWIANARRSGAEEVEAAARRRLIEIRAFGEIDAPDDAMVLDFWKSITALEQELSEERGKTIRLSRTRQKIARVGVEKTLADLALQPRPSEGYHLLRERGMLDLSAEAVVLRFPERFDQEVLDAAARRLASPPAADQGLRAARGPLTDAAR